MNAPALAIDVAQFLATELNGITGTIPIQNFSESKRHAN